MLKTELQKPLIAHHRAILFSMKWMLKVQIHFTDISKLIGKPCWPTSAISISAIIIDEKGSNNGGHHRYYANHEMNIECAHFQLYSPYTDNASLFSREFRRRCTL